MRGSLRIPIAALALLACCLPAAGAGAAGPPIPPTCAEGPVRIGDTAYGTPCADVIVAPPGVATVKGGGGDDTIVAAPISASSSCPSGCRLGVGSQTFEGGPGDDIVFGERGNDVLRGGEGDDRLYGGIGDDLLEGEAGDDVLCGGFGADGIDGGGGNDHMRGDATQDEIVDTGPASDVDTLSYATGVAPGFTRGLPTAHSGFPAAGGERGVYLDLAANLADNSVAPNGGGVDKVEGSDFERIVGSPFSDYIAGSKAGQQIYGGGGADVLSAAGEAVHLDGGADGDDCIGGATVTSCESMAANGPVVPRDTSKASVGEIVSGSPGQAQLYLVGSSGHDEVTLSYAAGSPATLTFGLTGSAFDTSPAADAGCEISGGNAVCPLPGPLDSVLVAGVGGDDALDGSGLPATTSLIVLGGAGDDTLTGGEESDDTLVDGPGGDALHGLGGDDAVLNNEGVDTLFGEGGNDLFLSNSICDGGLVSGGDGRDNASWAKFDEGVDVRLDLGVAGRPGGGTPQCGGGSLDSLAQVEDLEGTASADVFHGDAGPNQLLGHLGPDTYFSAAGEDSILANSGDFDPTISCGDDVDTAIIDRPQFGEVAEPDCENVFEADPNNFRTTTRLPPTVAPTPPPPADTRSPQTRIVAHPPKLIETRRAKRRVVFRFASSEAGSRFRCQLDRRPAKPCASPRAYLVGRGRHTVRIAAIDAAGNVDLSPAKFSFRVRRPV